MYIYIIYILLLIITINIYTVDVNNIYAFMRVKNEEKTINNSLNTLLPFINRGVIGYNDNSDRSEYFILDFCRKHINFKHIKYSYNVIPAGSRLYLKEQPYENRLDGYYNTVLNAIPNNNWLLKADADELFNSYLIYKIACIEENRKFLICLPRVNIYLINCTFYALKRNYIVNPCDQWLFFKTGKENFVMSVLNNSNGFDAYELLRYGKKELLYYRKIAIFHLSHLNSEMKKKFMNKEMINIFSLAKRKNQTIIVNEKMKKNLYDLQLKCRYE